jgi:dihydroneopterin triphosphate aldolase (PTPS-III) / 6-pyruvoyltetrahydropterin synthase
MDSRDRPAAREASLGTTATTATPTIAVAKTSATATAGEEEDHHHQVAFEVFVSKDSFKFNAAHFVAFAGYRERLHGHNYRVSVRLLGRRSIAADGYLIDFGNVKEATTAVCKALNEHFLCPLYSDVMDVSVTESSVLLKCEDGSEFVFPRQDCAMLPIAHATAEELGIYLYGEILRKLDASYLLQRGIHTMEVTVAEAPGQEAVFRLPIPTAQLQQPQEPLELDVRQFIASSTTMTTKPKPCASMDTCDGACGVITRHHLRAQLEQLAQAMNDNNRRSMSSNNNRALLSPDQEVTAAVLAELLSSSSLPSNDDCLGDAQS